MDSKSSRNMYPINLDSASIPSLDGNKISPNESNQHDFQDYLTDPLKPVVKRESERGLPSNNSSRTFFEKSTPGSPLPSKSLSHSLLSAECMPPYVSNVNHPYDFQSETSQAQDQQYQISPFNFHYDGAQEDYLRYRSGNFSNSPYDMSYIQNISHLSTHWDDLNPQHCNIPIGKRRPRSIMISGENTEKLRKMYEQPSIEDYPHQPEAKEVYAMPMGVSPGRYYYSDRPSQFPEDHNIRKSEVDQINGLIPDCGSSLNRSVFTYENNDDTLQVTDHICTANLSIDSNPTSLSHSINSRTKSVKIPGKRQKHVRKACIHCKKAHLACDEARPCKRCLHLGKPDCIDVEHKRRGRPRSSPEKKRVTQMSQEYMISGTNNYVDGSVYSIETSGTLTLPEIELDKAE